MHRATDGGHGWGLTNSKRLLPTTLEAGCQIGVPAGSSSGYRLCLLAVSAHGGKGADVLSRRAPLSDATRSGFRNSTKELGVTNMDAGRGLQLWPVWLPCRLGKRVAPGGPQTVERGAAG